MNDYTPTTEDVRRWYAEPQYERFDRRKRIVKQALASFDRWLARHDAEVAAKALRDAADSVKESSGMLSVQGVHRALRDRADRIEAFDD